MKIYIAGSSMELPRVESAAREAERIGCEVTHRWWEHVERTRLAGVSDAGLPEAEQAAYATGDLAGIMRATVLWLLVPEVRSEGSAIELGFAYAWRHRQHECGNPFTVLVSGPEAGRSVFHALADWRFASDTEALAWLASPTWEREEAAQ